MIEVDLDIVRRAFEYDEKTGELRHLQKKKSGKIAGWVALNGYRYVVVGNKQLLAHRVILALCEGQWPRGLVDHVNGIKTDNRLCNLRHASLSQNLFNKGTRSDSASGIKGVRLCPHGKWKAVIAANNQRYCLGYFNTATEASEAYRLAASRLHGEFARAE